MLAIRLYYLYFSNKNLKHVILLYLIYLASRVEGRKERYMWPLLRPFDNCPCQTTVFLFLPFPFTYNGFPTYIFIFFSFIYLFVF